MQPGHKPEPSGAPAKRLGPFVAGFPNWRYVIMAAIAGWFYGSAWHARRSLMAAAVTHASVDTLWHHLLTQ